MGRKRKKLPQQAVEARIESLSHDGRGLTHIDGKTVFVHGALAGERVLFRYTGAWRRYDEGLVTQVLEPAAERVTPGCPSFGICGGCSLQHMHPAAQILAKQDILADLLRRIGKVEPQRWLAPLAAEPWGYRRKARLGVRWVAKKGRVLVGFRERGSAFITDIERCDVLHPSIGERLPALARLIEGLSIRERVPQIEVAMGEQAAALVFRVLDPPSDSDLALLQGFAADTGLRVYLQSGGVDKVRALPGCEPELDRALSYSLPQHEIQIEFDPMDFTQVNLEMNRLMLDRALELLDPQPHEQILDLFCGLGNFTLPIARRAHRVVGVEGDEQLVQRARANARRNAIDNASFHSADLYADIQSAPWRHQHFDKALIDPPRSGAFEVLDLLAESGAHRLLYISRYPSTLARDADRLVNSLGYRLLAAGAMDMFPHTAHLESMALFER
ncbi:MAG TPA: 23S rRNA (uracil(1939)-C(5))-methyltransferase RlmD [Chromatiaceae bacterium]|nr:23S rRNA (uracil(1939)-C(5))-methyltransferase RlmD [Chromatiaceae bacterium]